MEKDLPIGVIDSGVGGLSVLKCLKSALPQEHFVYIGDTARTPYGSRDEQEVRAFVEEMLCWLDKQNIKLAVIACNTITVLGIDSLQKQHKFQLVGMSKGENLLVKTSKNKKVGVLATPFTIKSEAHKKAILACDAGMQVYTQACPKFVPLIENEILSGNEVSEAVNEYTQIMKDSGVDTVILSCTHYPFLRPEIEKSFGESITVIDPAEETAAIAKNILAEQNMLNTSGNGSCKICCTADLEKVKRLSAYMGVAENTLFEQVSLQ